MRWMDFDKHVSGEYIEKMLRLFDLPITPMNLSDAKSFLLNRKFSNTRGEYRINTFKELEHCRELNQRVRETCSEL